MIRIAVLSFVVSLLSQLAEGINAFGRSLGSSD
jgi:hypothetical protein